MIIRIISILFEFLYWFYWDSLDGRYLIIYEPQILYIFYYFYFNITHESILIALLGD